jgi:hypothetical protein
MFVFRAGHDAPSILRMDPFHASAMLATALALVKHDNNHKRDRHTLLPRSHLPVCRRRSTTHLLLGIARVVIPTIHQKIDRVG